MLQELFSTQGQRGKHCMSMISASVVTQGLSVRMPVIVYNGTFIMRAGTGEILAQENLSKEQAQKVRDVLDRHSVSPLVYAFIDGVEKVSWITAKENEGIRRYLSLRKGDRRLRPVADKKELYKGQLFYFTCIVKGDAGLRHGGLRNMRFWQRGSENERTYPGGGR